MLTFIIVQFLLLLHVHSELSVVNEVIKDPVAFAQSFAKATPEQINEVKKIINGLISDGQTKKNNLIQDHADSEKLLQQAKDELAVAFDNFEAARGERKLADIEVSRLDGVYTTRTKEESQALGIKNIAFDKLQDAIAWYNTENGRTYAENRILEDVINILLGLKQPDQELLSRSSQLAPIVPALIESVRVNPQSVDKVVDMVKDLIAANDAALAKAKSEMDSAQLDYNNKNEAWNNAVQATINAQEALSAGKQIAIQKFNVEKDFESAWNEATTKLQKSQAYRDAKFDDLNREVPIIDHEDSQLHKVLKILDDTF